MANTQTAEAGTRRGPWAGLFSPRAVARDAGYVLAGFPLTVLALAVLLPLVSFAAGTIVIWIGALALPVALLTASSFAQLSRSRVRARGGLAPAPEYRPRGEGLLGWLRIALDPRRWLDLLFESVVAFPLRALTWSVALGWISAAIGGLTWWIWGYFLPDSDQVFPGVLVDLVTGGTLPTSASHSYTASALAYAAIGLLAALTLPAVLRALALLDAAAVRAALCGVTGGVGAAAGAGADADPAPGLPLSAVLPRLTSAEGWSWIATIFAAVAAVAVGWPLLTTIHSVHVALAMVIIIAHAAALPLAVRFPAPAVVLLTVAPPCAAALSAAGAPWPWPITMLIVEAIAVLIVALRHSVPWTIAAFTLPQLAMFIVGFLGGPGHASTAANLIVCAAVSLGLGALGVLLRAFAVDRGALRAERRTNAELDARQRELAERNRVAQELHDVVAHSMSVVSVQANTAKYRISGLGEEAEAEFAAIAESSRQALGEMRGLLATLREREGAAPLAPLPTLDGLPALVEASRRSGARIDFEFTGADGSITVPPSTGLTAYRIVQEALANAVRHAPGSDIDVAVAVAPGGITVAVRNGAAIRDAVPAPGSGLGLAGLRERVGALGGTIAAGPTASGEGFEVRAELPL